MTIQIERDIPIPPPANPGRPAVYPFRRMAPKECFTVRLADSGCASLVSLQASLLNAARNVLGKGKVATRKLPDGSGFRVWRIA